MNIYNILNTLNIPMLGKGKRNPQDFAAVGNEKI